MSSTRDLNFNLLLNPFDTVRYQSEILPDSRSLHTSLWEKIGDTFHVFAGDTSIIEKDPLNKAYTKDAPYNFKSFCLQTRPGLMDYATLGIFRLVHALHSFLNNARFKENEEFSDNNDEYFGGENLPNERNPLHIVANVFLPVGYFLVSLLHFITNVIIRNTVSMVLTPIMLPIIVASHGLSKLIQAIIASKAAKDISVEAHSSQDNTLSTSTLYQALGATSYSNATVKKEVSDSQENPISSQSILNFYDHHSVLKAHKLWESTDKDNYKLMLANKSARLAILPENECQPRHRSIKVE